MGWSSHRSRMDTARKYLDLRPSIDLGCAGSNYRKSVARRIDLPGNGRRSLPKPARCSLFQPVLAQGNTTFSPLCPPHPQMGIQIGKQRIRRSVVHTRKSTAAIRGLIAVYLPNRYCMGTAWLPYVWRKRGLLSRLRCRFRLLGRRTLLRRFYWCHFLDSGLFGSGCRRRGCLRSFSPFRCPTFPGSRDYCFSARCTQPSFGF